MTYNYKTIVCHFDSTPRAVKRLQVSARIAERFDAHVIALYSVMSPLFSEPFVADGGAFVAQELLRYQERKDAEAKAAFDAISSGLARAAEWRSEGGDAATVTYEHGRCADLVVLGQYAEDQANDVTPDFIGRVMIASGRPVLVVPYAGEFPVIGRRIMVAWNASREAARAVTGALPFLRLAEEVHVISFNPAPADDGRGPVPGTDIAPFLTRHGVKPTVSTSTSRESEIGEQMLSRSSDFAADLIVMGGYGHSRAYEFVMGGATRTVLQSMTTPVLFAH
ncbi:MAG TPA: universal stress protein [Burkholderiaceae bacterium]|nr:universal stress protein [Burkholderiaceae bacterium]